jgi:hypothetical protein
MDALRLRRSRRQGRTPRRESDAFGVPHRVRDQGARGTSQNFGDNARTAASIAGLLLTTESLVVERPEKEKAPAMPGGGGMGDRD